MRYKLLLLISFLSMYSYTQDFAKINADLNLPDSLQNKIEIRIYKDRGTANYTSLLRMFKKDSNDWLIEFYEHFETAYKQSELVTRKTILKSLNDMECVYLNLLRSHILNLPNFTHIFWKLGKRGEVKKVKTKYRGKLIEEYQFLQDRGSYLLDSNGYHVQVKSWKSTNEFSFSNPDYYLKQNPEVDELIFMSEILNIIKTEFGIWKDQ
ncbi:MAG: hypothetical protein HRU26_04255 [Psychroserpens sp.]|nr:hypothetical protein [Psychroserpens sp.]